MVYTNPEQLQYRDVQSNGPGHDAMVPMVTLDRERILSPH